MDFECCFNLLRCHLLACTVFSIDPDAFFRLRLQQVTLAILPSVRLSTGSDPGLSPLIRKAGLLGQRRILINLLLCVPEPLVNLILLEIELLG